MGAADNKLERLPYAYGEKRRQLLLQFKTFKRALPGVPSYLVDHDRDAIVFGSDRILIRKTKEA